MVWAVVVGTLIVAVLVGLLIKSIFAKNVDDSSTNAPEEKRLNNTERKNSKTKNEAAVKKSSKVDSRKKPQQSTYTHAWLATNLKGHSGQVLDLGFSPNGKHVVTCSDDRTILIWSTNEFEEKEHKIVRGNIELDHATRICFAPDSKSLLVCLAHDNKIGVYKIVRKDNAGQSSMKIQAVEGVEYPSNLHKLDIINIGIACNGKYVMSASSDTTLIVWDLKGNPLKIMDTKQGNNNYAAVSPCGRFVACAGFTPDVKVWEVQFGKTGDFQDVVRAFELKGHSSGIYYFDFNQDSTRMASASKDGTIRIWNTDVRYQMNQDPIFMLKVNFDELKSNVGMLALAPNGDTVVASAGRFIRAFDAETGVEEVNLDDAHGSNQTTAIKFSSDNKYILTAGDRQVHVFHNVVGYKVAARKAKENVKCANTEAHKERLQLQADEAEQMVRKFVIN